MTPSPRRGITLAEVLLVVVILAIVIGLFMPAVRRVREPAARAKCANNLKQLMMGLHLHADAGGALPERATMGLDPKKLAAFPSGCYGPGPSPEERLSWMVPLLPFVEQSDHFTRFDTRAGYAGNAEPARVAVNLYVCPSLGAPPGDAVTGYVALAGLGADAATRPAAAARNGFMGYDRVTRMDSILDGTANTIGLTEVRTGVGPWARGGPSTVRGFELGEVPFAGHEKGFNAAMVDGSVRFVRDTADPRVFAAATTVAGGEKLDNDW